jgi:hypothetical protein
MVEGSICAWRRGYRLVTGSIGEINDFGHETMLPRHLGLNFVFLAVNRLSMKTVIEDLPLVSAAQLRTSGAIAPGMSATTIRFDDSDVEYGVGLRLLRFPGGGAWVLFSCPRCHGGARKLRLLGDMPACSNCLSAAGLRYRVEMASHAGKRAALTAPRRIALLDSDKPARVNARPGRTIERRALIEMALERSIIVAREYGIAEFEKASKS